MTIQVVVRIPGVVVPALIAVVSAATLLPLVDRLAARGWSRGARGRGLDGRGHAWRSR